MNKKLLFSTFLSIAAFNVAVAEDKVVASVNGEKIYYSEIARNFELIPGFKTLPDEQKKAIETKLIDATTKLRAVVQEAENLKLDETKEFKAKMDDFSQQLLYSTLLERHLENFVTEAKLKEFYNKNKDQFVEDKANASHILLESKKKAKEVIQKLQAGEDFAKLAKEFSIGPSANDGGNLGWFNRDAMVKEFSDATFKLKNGKFTKEPVQTQFGWHVILLKEKKEQVPSLFEDVKQQIKQEVSQTEVENYLRKIIDNADIVLNDK